MQQGIGERLQQARQRLGMSIDDVVNKLKIRKDVILKFEANEFDMKLPIVYKKGFLKSYAKLLKMNVTQLMSDYDTITGDKIDSTGIGYIKLEDASGTFSEGSEKIKDLDTNKENSAQFVKPIPQFVHFRLLICMVVLVALCVIVTFSHKFFSHKNVTENFQVQEVKNTPVEIKNISLIGLDTVQVFVRRESDKKRLFSGTINKGDRQIIEKSDALQISYSEGENLVIENDDGTNIKPNKPGRGWLRLQ